MGSGVVVLEEHSRYAAPHQRASKEAAAMQAARLVRRLRDGERSGLGSSAREKWKQASGLRMAMSRSQKSAARSSSYRGTEKDAASMRSSAGKTEMHERLVLAPP